MELAPTHGASSNPVKLSPTPELQGLYYHCSWLSYLKKTTEWAKKQDNLTVTLDIGTEYGIPLLAVLFINAGKSKLVDIVPFGRGRVLSENTLS